MFIRIPGAGLWFDDVSGLAPQHVLGLIFSVIKAWAIFSTLSLITQVVAVFMHLPNPGECSHVIGLQAVKWALQRVWQGPLDIT